MSRHVRRRPVTVRMPTTFRNRIEEMAGKAGMTMNEFMVRILADRVGYDLAGYQFQAQSKDRHHEG